MRKFIGICVAAAILVSMLAFTPLASVAVSYTHLFLVLSFSDYSTVLRFCPSIICFVQFLSLIHI